MKINLKLNTIFFTYAPSGSGKSYFCKTVLIEQLKRKYPFMRITYLSSDDIRRDILGENLHKYDSKMGKASKQAFERIYERTLVESSYPNNSDLIIIDTIGINKEFREKLTTIAIQNNYQTHAMVFQYTDVNDYYKYNDLDELNCRAIINTHLKSFKENLSNLRANTMSVITSKDFNDIEVLIDKKEELTRLQTVVDLEETPIVGDVHGCLDELKEVVKLNLNKQIVLIGDFIGLKVHLHTRKSYVWNCIITSIKVLARQCHLFFREVFNHHLLRFWLGTYNEDTRESYPRLKQ